MQAAIANRRINRPDTIFLATMLEDAASALVKPSRLAEARAYLGEATKIRMKSGLAPLTESCNFNTRTRIRLAWPKAKWRPRSLVKELSVDPDETLGISTAIHAGNPELGEQYRLPLRQLQARLAGATK